ncbi:MAG TPA: hypothetical protein VF367_02290 [Candidatus Limnocylindria bacterium]|jgi:hypothetical protein
MHRRQPRRAAVRALLALGLVLSALIPAQVGAVSPKVTLSTQASPLEVTVNLPIAYVVDLKNGTSNALKNVRITGATSTPLTFLAAFSTGSCEPGVAVCQFNGLAAGATARAIFYYQAPSTPQTFTFTAFANFDGQTTSSPAQYQNTSAAPVLTEVLAVNENLVRGHAIGQFTTFSTGLDTLSTTNRHGTEVYLTDTGEVTVRDLTATAANQYANCRNLLGVACFGEASELDVKDGLPVAGGLEVTMRWDFSDLPNGMTEKKIRFVHFFDGGTTFELITAQCSFVNGVVQNVPCLDGEPIRLADKDIQATVILGSNGVVRGW